mmetsp:Transcript_57610/g.185029  ORF Transcript_57610/g.185029 Transcript_57610/m.185029 type:complete len:207 (+) Transcript_57610:566-1186(+)
MTVFTKTWGAEEVLKAHSVSNIHEGIVVDVNAVGCWVQQVLPESAHEEVRPLRDEEGLGRLRGADGAVAVAPQTGDSTEHRTLANAALAGNQQRIPVRYLQGQVLHEQPRGVHAGAHRRPQRERPELQRGLCRRLLRHHDVATESASPLGRSLDVADHSQHLPEPLHCRLALDLEQQLHEETLAPDAATSDDAFHLVLCLVALLTP